MSFTTRVSKAWAIVDIDPSKLMATIFVAAVVMTLSLLPLQSVGAASLTTASMALSDSRPSQTSVQYTFTGSNVTLSSVKCIKMVFATTVSGSTLPTGMSTTSVAVSASSNYVTGVNGWTVDGSTTNGTVLITDATGATPASAAARTVILTGITNSSTVDTNLFVQFSTFDNVDCATTPRDTSTVAFIITNGQSVSASVDPSISFAVAGTASSTACNGATSNVTTTASTVPLGTATAVTNKIGVQNLTVTTNAGNGYTVYAKYTGLLTSGSNTIANHSGTNAAPTTFSAAGTAAYGYTTNDAALGTGTADRFTSSGGNKWAAFSTTNTEIAYNTAAVSNETTCVGQQVGIAGSTPAGTYTTTVVYTATPVY